MRHLSGDRACSIFLDALEQTRKRFGLRVYGFVVMPEHVHLLVSEPGISTLDRALQSLKISCSRLTRDLRAHEHGTSPLWQKRYYDRYTRTDSDFVEKLRYIHRNPVRRDYVCVPKIGRGAAFDTMLRVSTWEWRSNPGGRREQGNLQEVENSPTFAHWQMWATRLSSLGLNFSGPLWKPT